MDACVDTEDLVAMAEGHLSADRVEAVLIHVDRCRICAEIIANLARDAAPRDVGRYQLGRVLGAGAMGVVYDAWDPELRRRVAVKLVRPERTDDDVSHARILREARALARISHPNVVAVYDVGDTAGQIYLATELVDGETMLTWCDTRDTPAIVDAWIQAARGLAAAHAQGFVHRDVKPANVFVGRDGRVRIGDFGLARSAPGDTVIDLNDPTQSGPRRRALTDGAFVGGTPAYMAPEQWRGAGDARSDQFALCVAICESLTGIRPDPDELPPIAPGALAAVLSRGLRATPSERFASMDELADALAGALAGALAQRPQLAQMRRRRILVAAGIVGLLASIAWTSSSERAAPACEPAQLPAGVWSLPQRAVASAKLPPGIVAHVDTWLTGWSAMAADVCATDAPPALRARRRQCVDDALDDAAATLSRWQTTSPTPLAAQYAIETWQRPARCALAAVAATPSPQPEQAFAIAPLRARMTAMLAALHERPDHLPVRLAPAALFELRDVLAGARALGFAPFVVEVEFELARRLGDRDGAIALLREAMMRATAARDTRMRAASTAALIRMLDAAHVGEAIQLADALRPELVATADHEAEGELEVALGNALRWAHRLDEAIAAYERARRSFHEAYGPDSQHEVIVLTALDGAYTQIDWDSPGATGARAALAAIARATGVPRPPSPHDSPEQLLAALGDLAATTQPGGAEEANVHFSLGALHALLGNREQALAHYRRYTALAARLGIRDTTTASAEAMIASLLVDLGRPAEALPAADQAVAHALAVGLDTELAQALTIQGAARLLSNQLAAAREPLARALAIREAGNAGAAERSRTRFLYARALAPIDRRRALDLATTARVELQGYLRALGPSNVAPYLRAAQQARLVEIERWLRGI